MEQTPEGLGLGDSSLHRYLDGEFWSLKNELRRALESSPLFQPRYDLSLDEMRDLTNQRVKFVLSLPLLKRVLQDQEEKRNNFISQSFVLGEVLCMVDVSMSIKEFVIDMPCENAQKMYIGNAMHGNYAAVFAQLIIEGKSQGPHCFIVPIRDENGNLYPGVTAIDMMYKEGLNGVDNGILIFDKVRIPRENMLDKLGSVTPDGQYHSPIQSKSARFNAMLAILTPSRLAVTFQAMGAMKLGLMIAIRYSHSRRQFGPKGKEEVKIIEHQMQALRLMSHLATALALTFTSRHAGHILDEDILQGRELINRRSLQALMAGLKAYSTWETVRCLQDCRECTGGMGYMMENRLSGLKCDTDVFVTFEGDNVVMLQVVARELLAQYSKQHKKNPFLGMIQNWTETAMDKLRTSFLVFNTDTVGHLAFLLKAVNFRERVLQRSLVSRIYYKVVTEKGDFFRAWNSCMHHVISLSLAHVHRVALEQFTLAVRQCPNREDQALLMKFCLLYGTKLLFQERGWYLEHKYLTPAASMRIRAQLLNLCESVKDDSLKVISAFNIPHTTIHAPTAGTPNTGAAEAFSPAPTQPLVQNGTRSRLAKL
uniref:Acyl-coenzyme A oxidase n=1 Tax=Rattus norvegicus TaxID=10116 RepID=A0ABK0M6A0_RAT